VPKEEFGLVLTRTGFCFRRVPCWFGFVSRFAWRWPDTLICAFNRICSCNSLCYGVCTFRIHFLTSIIALSLRINTVSSNFESEICSDLYLLIHFTVISTYVQWSERFFLSRFVIQFPVIAGLILLIHQFYSFIIWMITAVSSFRLFVCPVSPRNHFFIDFKDMGLCIVTWTYIALLPLMVS
jgi:hypothetical protein